MGDRSVVRKEGDGTEAEEVIALSFRKQRDDSDRN